MKKVKQSKKRWAWTKAQQRKSYNHDYWYTPPKWFREGYHAGNRQYEKSLLIKIKNGDYSDSYFTTKFHSSSAKWDWA
jgi:hypothetical protein